MVVQYRNQFLMFNKFVDTLNKKNHYIYMASILVYFIILTDNFEKIGLIRVLSSHLNCK